ncbi:hypothetical protein D3C76_1295640 [compost metagenome]
MQARFYGGMDTGLAPAFEQFSRNLGLHERFTAGQRQASAGTQIVRLIAHHFGHHRINVERRAADAQRAGWATAV